MRSEKLHIDQTSAVVDSDNKAMVPDVKDCSFAANDRCAPKCLPHIGRIAPGRRLSRTEPSQQLLLDRSMLSAQFRHGDER